MQLKNNKFSPKKKDKIKIIRSIVQGLILLVILVVTVKTLFTFTVYKPFSPSAVSEDKNNGFIAVSYYGVDRDGSKTLISTGALEEQIKALKDNGYVTINQQDILDYYNKGKALPEKSLFLLFEDGRKDTAIFSQKILEQYNYKANIMTYADKLEKNDSKFLAPKDLLKLKSSSYWELGTNGYRLEYLNVYDKDLNFLGNLSSAEFSKGADKIQGNYNHYLMDYIRDKNKIPMENYDEMKARISKDYGNMLKIYNKEIGYVPGVSALMHSNTGKFGTNDNVSEVNSKLIKELFSVNFNREGYSLNLPKDSIYDLTRIKSQTSWSTNHLLMRIWDDTKKNIQFVEGDKEKAKNFQKIKGQAEFTDDKIIVTSLPKGNGLIKLLNSESYRDINLSVLLNGNVIGSQAVYLRSNDTRESSICVKLINNTVNVIENSNGSQKIIYSSNLSPNNKEFNINEAGNKKVNISLWGNKMTLSIDGKKLFEALTISNVNEGSIFLEAGPSKNGNSEKNTTDDVYDGVFKNLKITNLNNTVLFDSSLKGTEAIIYELKNSYNKVVNWFIKNL